MKSKKTILFDFDGTIADSLHRLLEISNSFAEQYGYRKVNMEDIPYYRTKSTLETFRELKVPLLKVPMIAKKVKRAFQEEAHLSRPYAGMVPVLPALQYDYSLGILTSNTEKNVRKFLQHHGLCYFDFIYTSSNLFGKSRILGRILRENSLRLEETIYVGDEMRDIEAARQLNMEMVAVSWGAHSAETLARLRPTHLIHQPEELLTVIS